MKLALITMTLLFAQAAASNTTSNETDSSRVGFEASDPDVPSSAPTMYVELDHDRPRGRDFLALCMLLLFVPLGMTVSASCYICFRILHNDDNDEERTWDRPADQINEDDPRHFDKEKADRFQSIFDGTYIEEEDTVELVELGASPEQDAMKVAQQIQQMEDGGHAC